MSAFWCWRRKVCRHEFRLADLTLTGIPKPPDPRPGATLAELNRWGDEVVCGQHPWHTERVSWRCCKCGTEFREHCGLDVLAKHGRICEQPVNKLSGVGE